MKKVILASGVISSVLLAGCGQKAATTTDVTSNSSATTVTTTVSSTTNSELAATQNFNISQTYSAPENSSETLVGTITTKDGLITAVNVEKNGTTREAKTNISNFADGISSAVVGKSLKGLQISKVGGASLSSDAFNQALSKINS